MFPTMAAQSEEGEVGVVSADFFFSKGGKYRFDPRRLAEAHQECLREFTRMVTAGEKAVVFVDNTNTTVSEIVPYYALAEAHGYEAVVMTFRCSPEEGAARNVHGVSLDACRRMAERLEETNKNLPPWWRRVDAK